jgi:ribulose-phosphate 3-epimerase
MDNKIAPSMMCCDFLKLGEQLCEFEKSAVELLHIDIMDGSFVPNFALGTDFVRKLKAATRIPVDVHFMVEYPERHIQSFPLGEGDIASVHFEATKHLQRALRIIKDTGARAFVAINPATPIVLLSDVLDDIDGVLIMSVNPGFAGQKMVPHAIEKIAALRRMLDEAGRHDVEIEVDGNVSIENAIRMKAAGANIFVLGTSSIFIGDMEQNIRNFRDRVFG